MKWPVARMHTQAGKGYGMYETAARLEESGADVIHLEVGRPSSITPSHIREAAKKALDDGIVHYSELMGISRLREALSDRYQRERAVDYMPDEILITAGVTQASFAAIMSTLEEGDEAIVVEPFYPQHNSKIRFAGARVVVVTMRQQDGRFRFDAEALERAITPATRLVILINPTNPTGTVYTRGELESLAEVVIRHDLLVLADEVYEYIVFDGLEHISIASLPGMKERTVTVSAFTKAYAMDGWRIGYAAAPAPMIDVMRRVTMNTTTHPCVFAQEGAVAAVMSSQDCVRQMVEEDRLRRELVVESLNSIAGVHCPMPEGAIYAFPDISGLGIDSDELAQKILDEGHVAVESGSFYGKAGRGHLRICFGSEPYERLAQGMARLRDCLS